MVGASVFGTTTEKIHAVVKFVAIIKIKIEEEKYVQLA